MEYDNFEIEIDPVAGLEYEVSVRSPAGEARQTMHFPYDKLALESRLKDLQIALLRSGGKRRRMVSREERAVQSFGLDLFNALIANEVRSRYDTSQNLVGQNDRGLRLILRIQDATLAALPWEFMYDSRKGEYVSLSRNTPIVRYPEHPHPVQALRVKPPLNILCMAVSPDDLDRLDIDREKHRLEDAVKGLDRFVTLTWLENNTWQHLQETMRRGPWHIFHFIGHGAFNERMEEGTVALADETGRAFELSATKLARLLDHRHLKLVVLNACESGRASAGDIFSSTASILVRSGIPAVLAMQYEITDSAAIEFSRSFYGAVAQGFPLEAAVVEARKAISIAVNNSVEWGTPVLFLRSADGRLFDVNLEKEQVDPIYRQAIAALEKEDWPDALEKIKTVLDQEPSHQGAQDAQRVALEQQRLAHLYTEGQVHYNSSRWRQAQESLQGVERINPNYKDVSTLLQNIERKIKEGAAETLHTEAAVELKAENWKHAIELLERAIQLSPDNQKIKDDWDRATRELKFAEVYADGKALFDAGKWSDALTRLNPLKTVVGQYKDVQVLCQQATEKLKEKQQQSRRARLLELHHKAEKASSQADWLDAASLLEEILNLDPENVEAKAKLKLMREQERLDMLYTAAHKATSSHRWQEALEQLQQISSIDADYKDVRALAARARHEVHTDFIHRAASADLENERFDEARAKLNELIKHDPERRKTYVTLLDLVRRKEALKQAYDRAMAHHGDGRVQEAYQAFQEVSQMDPGYRDVGPLLETIKRDLAKPIPLEDIVPEPAETESTENKKIRSPVWWGLRISAVAIVLFVLGFLAFKFSSSTSKSDSTAIVPQPATVHATTSFEPKTTERESIPTNFNILKVALSPDGEIVAALGNTNTVNLWTLSNNQPGKVIPQNTGERGSLVFDPTDSEVLASGNFDSTINVWDLNLTRPLTVLREDAGYIFSLNFTADGKELVSGSFKPDSRGLGLKTITVWQTSDWRPKESLTFPRSETIVAVNADQGLVAVSKGSGAGIELRSLSDNSVQQRLEAANPNAVASAAFSQDGQTLAVVYKRSSSVFLWNTEDGKLKEHSLKAASGEANVIAFSPDAQLLAGGWADGTVLLWSVNDGRLISTLTAHSGPVACVVFSANGQVMASSGADRKIRLWQLSYGR